MRSPALAAYLLASRLADPVALPLLRRRMARGKEEPARLAERLGRAGLARPAGRLVWLHAASVGEATSALPLIAALRGRMDANFLLTTGTVSSAQRMACALPPGAVHQYAPVDTHRAVRRFLGHWRPDLGIWIESEIWPRLVLETARREVPMALVNARLSAGSFRRWRRLPAMARRLLGSFRTVLAQDGETVERLRELGVEARFAGNLKALVTVPECNEGELAALRGALGRRPVWLAASTHAGEERAVLDAQKSLRQHRPLLILAPRHPERGDDVAQLVAAAGLSAARRSAGGVPDSGTDVWLADTLGEMGLWYRLAPIAFVGGSLVGAGGHTPFEPVQLGSAVLHGPHVANFAPAYAALDGGGGAVAVADAAELAAALGRLIADPAALGALRDRARAVHEGLKPDPAAIAAELAGLVGGSVRGRP
jgi:3-deoxy-D-manno-octulosonic-acid transferase